MSLSKIKQAIKGKEGRKKETVREREGGEEGREVEMVREEGKGGSQGKTGRDLREMLNSEFTKQDTLNN